MELKGKETRAGSTLLAINAVKNAAKFTNTSFEKTVSCMTVNPAKSLGIYDKKGSIEVLKDADFVVLDDNLDILETYSVGNCVYKK